jgi:hypothetical protein
MTENKIKNYSLKIFFLSKTIIYPPLGFHKDFQATEEAFSPQKKTSSTSKPEIS